MPVYNEAAWIERSVGAILSQDYPLYLIEVLIADSQSDDGTADFIRVIAQNRQHDVRLLDNPARTPGAALNLMIGQATGDIIIRVDGHAVIASDYVRQCVDALLSTDALNVGGYISAFGNGFMERAIAMAIGSFWGNGGAEFRSGPAPRPRYVDTVPFGAWHRKTFARLGPFMEWPVNEDCEFNARILDAGGKILLHPAIGATYFPRRSLAALAAQYFRYGRLKCRVMARHPRQLRARQLAPPLFILMLAALALAGILGPTTSLVVVALLGYIITIGIGSAWIAFRRNQHKLAAVLPAVFATLHFSYGIGVLLGAIQLLIVPLLAFFRGGKIARATDM